MNNIINEAIAFRKDAIKYGKIEYAMSIQSDLLELGIILDDRPDGSTGWIKSSAARDAALEEAAGLCDEEARDYPGPAPRRLATAILALKSIAAPVASCAEKPAGISWLENVFHGDPPLPHASWNDWMAEATQSRVISGVTIRQVSISDYSAKAPALVQQAAPSDAADKWRTLALQYDGHRMQALAHLKCMVENPATHRSIAAQFLRAAPAQPAGLSEQDKLDAARYRWLRANHETYVPDGDLPALWEHKKRNDYGMKSFVALDSAIDAILAAKAAP